MDPRDSGIFRLASVGSYLDALSTITDEMSLKERSNLILLDRALHEHWGLGQNVILNWCPEGDGLSLIVIPHYGVADYATNDGGLETRGSGDVPRPKQDFFQALLSGRRCLTPAQLHKVGRLLGVLSMGCLIAPPPVLSKRGPQCPAPGGQGRLPGKGAK